MDGRTKKVSLKVQNKETGICMDLLDVKDELENLMHYYEYLVKRSEAKEDKYKHGYTALALATACNVVSYYLRDSYRINQEIEAAKKNSDKMEDD